MMLDEFFESGMRPDEFLSYSFDTKSKSQRLCYMSQREKDKILIEYYKPNGNRLINQLRDKYLFYTLARPYFQRDVISISSAGDLDTFMEFCKKHSHFICKANNSGCGVGIMIREVEGPAEAKLLFNELISQGTWIIEELISQDAKLAALNPSSVNTVRFPSFRHGNHVVADFALLRSGRAGSVVDNAAQGGVFASIDVQSGMVISNGYDELGHCYNTHPDSEVSFKGFQIPEWSELLNMARQAHLSLPDDQVYVAFDCALSDKGWVIVEGNWGDLFMQQISLGRGLKQEFLNLLNG